MLSGWKTVLVNVLNGIAALGTLAIDPGLLSAYPRIAGAWVAVTSIANILLRALTNTPIGQAK